MSVRPITVFLESRFQIADDRAWFTTLSAEAGEGWAEPVSVAPARLAARAATGVTEGAMPVEGPTIVLPSYNGMTGALRSLPVLLRTIDDAVAGSSAIAIKVPGIIGLLAVRSARRAGVPIVAQVVGDIEDVLRSGVAGKVGKLLARPARMITAASLRNASVVRFVTERTLQAKYPPHPSAVALSFSDVHLLGPARWLPSSDSLSSGRIVAVGSQEQSYKGHDILIRALAELRTRGTAGSPTLTLVGAGRTQPALRALTEELGLAGAVRFAGHVASPGELAQLLLSSEVFALPSRTEGMPRALIEAMGLGVPCVASRVGGVAELLPDEATVPSGDVGALSVLLERVLTDRRFAISLSRCGVQRAESFSAPVQEKLRERWLDAVARVVGVER